MGYLAITFLLLFLTIIEHVVWSRWTQAKGLAVASFYCILFLNALWYQPILKFSVETFMPLNKMAPNFWNIPLSITAFVLYILLGVLYFAFYTSIAIDSPTRTTLRLIQKKGKATYEDLSKHLADNSFVVSRLDALVKHRLVVFDGRPYRLSQRGMRTARILNFYQKIFGRNIGG